MPLIDDLRYWICVHFQMTPAQAAELNESEVLEKYRAIPR